MLAKLLCINYKEFYYYEHNTLYPKLKTIKEMIEIFKVDPKELMDSYYLFISKDNSNFFKNLKSNNNWTYKDINRILGISTNEYCRWISGKNIISRESYIKLIKRLRKLNFK